MYSWYYRFRSKGATRVVEVDELNSLMTRHIALTNEVLGVVNENRRLFNLLNSYVLQMENCQCQQNRVMKQLDANCLQKIDPISVD